MKKIIGFYRKCDLMTMLGTVMALSGVITLKYEHYMLAILFLVAAGLCDAFDGHLARKGNYSDMQKNYGVQLDSLSDVICFGVFPAFIAISCSSKWYVYVISVFYVLCGVVRLAYFNTINIDNKSKKRSFIGVPITTVSIVLPIVFVITKLIKYEAIKITIPITLLLLGFAFIIGIEYPKIDVAKILKKIFNVYVVDLLVLPFLLVFGSDVIFKLNHCGILTAMYTSFVTMFSYFIPTVMVILIALLIYLIITSIVGKPRISKLIFIILIGVLMLVNDIKYHIMTNPLEFSDINYLNPDNINMMGNSTGSIGSWVWISILKSLVFMGICSFVSWRNIEKKKFDLKRRAVVFFASLIMLFGGLSILFHNNVSIMNNVYKITFNDANMLGSNAEVYKKTGFWQGLLYNAISKVPIVPDDYSSEYADSILASYTDIEKNVWGKANVVFILSESFSDVEHMESVKFDKDLMPNIHSYEKDKNKMVFDLTVAAIGGGSVNTEFEILTGASVTFFSHGFIPYTQYYNDFNGKYAPNLITEFNNNGYETIYLTPWGDTSFKSGYIYSLFGTDRKIYGKDLKGEVKGKYYSDKSLMEDIYNELKDTSEGNYKFIMAATAQNHYPYDGDKYNEYDISITDSTLTEEQQKIILNYAQGIYDADKELNNLYNMIKKLDTPTIVVFYGDHLPYTADSTGYAAYIEDNYFKTDDGILNNYRMFTTKAVILSNFNMPTDDIKVMNSNYLGAYVANNMDIKLSNHFKYVADLLTKIPSFTRMGIRVGDEIHTFADVPEENKLLEDFKKVQYREFYDYEK